MSFSSFYCFVYRGLCLVLFNWLYIRENCEDVKAEHNFVIGQCIRVLYSISFGSNLMHLLLIDSNSNGVYDCCCLEQNVRRKKICNHYFIIIDARWRCFCLAFFFSFCLNDFDLNIMYYDACLVFFLSSAICSEYIIKLWSEMKMFDGLSFNLRWRWNYLALFAFLYCIFLRKSIQKSHSKLLFLNHIVI